jgi:hypothetical protein
VPDQKLVRELLASDATDRVLGVRLNVSHMTVGRHRRNHVVAPLQAAMAAVDRSRSANEQQARKLARIRPGDEHDDPLAIVTSLFGALPQARKLQQIEQRLETAAEQAAENEAHQHVAALSAQQLRSFELGGRLSGIPGFRPAVMEGTGGAATRFSIQIHLANKTTTINAVSTSLAAGAVVDAEGNVIAENTEADPERTR